MRKVFASSARPGKSGKKDLGESAAEGENNSDTEGSKILVAYFSHSGNTRVIAHQIHERVGGNVFEIVPLDPYPCDYDEVVEQARKELSDDYRPGLRTKVQNMDSYNVVFIGYPNWWGTVPRPVAAFLSEYDLSGKTIAPFCTHGGSRLARSVEDIRKLCPKSTVPEGLAVHGSVVRNAQNAISRWLHEIGFAE